MSKEKKEESLQDALNEIEQIIEKLSDRECSLEDSFTLYKKGMDLIQYSNKKIDAVEKKVLQINKEGEMFEF